MSITRSWYSLRAGTVVVMLTRKSPPPNGDIFIVKPLCHNKFRGSKDFDSFSRHQLSSPYTFLLVVVDAAFRQA